MNWKRCLLITLGIMLITSPVAGGIKHFTDSQGTLHISNAETDRQNQETEPAGAADPGIRSEKPQTPLPSTSEIPPRAGAAEPPEPTKPSPGEESIPQEDKGLETPPLLGEDDRGPEEARHLPATRLSLPSVAQFSALWSNMVNGTIICERLMKGASISSSPEAK